jgi:hypothetical protein
MKRILCLCLLLTCAACGKPQQETTAVVRRAPPPVRLTFRKAVVEDVKPDPPESVAQPPARRLTPLDAEVDAYLSEPPIKVTSPQLLKAYQKEEEADKRFQDNKVWVTGYVLHWGRSPLGQPYVDLAPAPGENGLVRCSFEKRHGETVSELKEKQEVTIEGRVSAKGGNQVRINDCRLLTAQFMRAVTEAADERKSRN